ncbi:MAG: XRE family transcriptional regulator [Pseudomonadota bacterium]
MTTRDDIMEVLAQNLKAVRTEKGLSLDAVAKLSGVSRSMVSQIERGTSSPTVATLWNLTQALGVDFAGIIDAQSARPQIEILKADEAPTIAGHGQGCSIRILSPPETVGKHEVYELAFEKGGALESDPHDGGTREQLTVLSGTIEVTSGEESEMLGAGDTARYAADAPHAIRAPKGKAMALLIVHG